MGFHFHFWNLLLACVPSACIIMYFGSVKRETDIPWVNNNAGLAQRIQNLEMASFGEVVDESPEADAKRRAELLQAGTRVRSQAVAAAAARAGQVGVGAAAASGEDDDDEYEDAETQEVISDLMSRVQRLEQMLSDALRQLKTSTVGGGDEASGDAGTGGASDASSTATAGAGHGADAGASASAGSGVGPAPQAVASPGAVEGVAVVVGSPDASQPEGSA